MVRDPLSHVRERFLMCTAGSFFRVILNAATLAAVGLFGVYVLTQVLGVDDVVKNASIAALLLVPLPVVVLLMRHIPAIPNQKLASPALAQDAAYFFLRLVLRVTFLAILYAGLRQFYDHYLSWLTIESADQLPVWGRLLASILFSDFLNWLHHYLRHKVPLFWSFHTVHHSQQHLNFFSDGRTHLFEYVIAALIIFLPLFAVRIETPTILAWVIVKQWASLIYHSNLRTNYGLLRYVLVTPQSHRVPSFAASPAPRQEFWNAIEHLGSPLRHAISQNTTSILKRASATNTFRTSSRCGPIRSSRPTGRSSCIPFVSCFNGISHRARRGEASTHVGRDPFVAERLPLRSQSPRQVVDALHS